jgi:hypothetical protein
MRRMSLTKKEVSESKILVDASYVHLNIFYSGTKEGNYFYGILKFFVRFIYSPTIYKDLNISKDIMDNYKYICTLIHSREIRFNNSLTKEILFILFQKYIALLSSKIYL